MKKYTKQEFFNVVWRHAQKMKKCTNNGTDEGTCLYADGRGNACFIGATLDRDDYRPTLEGKGVATLLKLGLLEIEGMHPEDAEIFMVRLQEVHDCYPVVHWNNELRIVAAYHNLEVPV